MEDMKLLSFVSNASSNIQEALGKPPKRRRNITVKKFVENRVKRLGPGSCKKPRAGSLTKSKSAPLTIPARLQQSSSIASLLQGPWPVVDNLVPSHPIQSTAIPTSSYPTSGSSNIYPNSESSVCLRSSQPIDPELESLLSEFECSSAAQSRRGSYESICTGSSSTPPLITLDTQVYLGEQAFSPHSDYSEELEDSAYCSPVESARVSYNCSPTNLGCPMPDWSSSDWLSPVPQQEVMVSSACEWVDAAASPRTVSSTSSVVSIYDCDQGPPMTPTVSQLLDQYNPY